jgi:hypothetical protein
MKVVEYVGDKLIVNKPTRRNCGRLVIDVDAGEIVDAIAAWDKIVYEYDKNAKLVVFEWCDDAEELVRVLWTSPGVTRELAEELINKLFCDTFTCKIVFEADTSGSVE